MGQRIVASIFGGFKGKSQLPNVTGKCVNKVMNHEMTYNGFKQILFKTSGSCFIIFLTICSLITGSPRKRINYP